MVNARYCIVALLVALLLPTTLLAADKLPEYEGTKPEDLAMLKLPVPATTTVAVLPYWDYKSMQRHIDLATGLSRDMFERHGFGLTSSDAIAQAVKADKDIEPGQAFRRTDALRIGKQLGASWVVYGEVLELETYTKNSFFKGRKKKGKVTIRVSILDVPSETIIYWHKRSDTSGGTGFDYLKRAASIERRACEVCLDRCLSPLFEALPKHEVKPAKPDTEKEDTATGGKDS